MCIVLPYASYSVLCILKCLPRVLLNEAPYVRLVMYCVLSYLCYKWVRPFGLAKVQQGRAWVLDQTSHIANLKQSDNSCHPLRPTVRVWLVPLLWLPNSSRSERGDDIFPSLATVFWTSLNHFSPLTNMWFFDYIMVNQCKPGVLGLHSHFGCHTD